MVNAHAQFAIQKQLERDAYAALSILSADEKSSLWRVAVNDTNIAEPHKKKLLDLCLAADRGGRLVLTALGQSAADAPPGQAVAAKQERARKGVKERFW
jgi:hypothetical protein